MRVGIFGGTFDPIHCGHLVLAEQCREQCRLDEVWFVPAGQPPHKAGVTITEAKFRREMIEFAISGNSSFRLNSLELNRAGPSFTVTTLEQLHAEHADHELFLMIGADSLLDFPRWRDPQRILELATVIALNRGDQPLPNREEIRNLCGGLADSRIISARMPGIDLSATEIRNRCREGRSIRYLVPRAVEIYIDQHGLYRSSL